MAQYTRRVQAVLTQDQYETLVELSENSGKPLSALIREAIQEVYLKPQDRARRQDSLDRLLSLQAPVGDWEEIEQEITRGAVSP